MDELYNANVRIENMDRATMTRLGQIASMRGVLMRDIIKIALMEFVMNHEAEIPR